MAHSSYGDFSPLSNSQRPNASNISDDFESTATAYAQDYGSIELESDGVATAEAPFGRIYAPVRGFQAAVDVEEDVREDAWRAQSPYYRWGKRAFDIVFSCVLMLVALPLACIIAFLIKLDSSGPVLYVSTRAGKKGELFECYKFRTMVQNAEKLKADLLHLNERNGPFFKIAKDPRITRLGQFLRKSSLDELPQILNVLKGDMSIVGPRPHPLDDYAQYSEEHLRRLDVLPGLTGLWQVSARQDPSFERNMELDLEYIENWTLWMDISILMRTLPAVFRGTGQ